MDKIDSTARRRLIYLGEHDESSQAVINHLDNVYDNIKSAKTVARQALHLFAR